MRNVLNLNKDWLFIKNETNIAAEGGEAVSLPHSWNAIDGQDGGNDYFRGTCLYKKTIRLADLPEAAKYFLEIRGANSSADVYLNGIRLAGSQAAVSGFGSVRISVSYLEKVNQVLPL